MLGTRTKQVFSYGRRGHRIVSISDDHENDIASNNNRDPWRTPIVVKTKIHHHFPSESPSPQFVRVQNRASKKKRPSPSLSPASLKKKRTRVRQIVKGNVSAKSKTDATPRRPLSCHYPNVPGVPGSPVVRTKKNARVAGAKGTPLGNKMSKPFSPFMDMDIIVLDNDGKRISQERRVSRTDVVVNPPVREAAGDRVWKGILKKQHEPQVIVLSDSDDEQAAPKPPKRAGGRSKAIILSSDESEADEPIATPPKSKTKSRAQPAPKAKPVQRLQMEVVISPIKRVVKPKPKYWSPTPELPPTPLATKYVPVPIPQPRARQLTPIRRGASKALFRTYSPTPTNLTDLDTSLDFDFGDLTLSPSHAIQSIPPPEYLIPLLDECGQKTPHEFSAFIETFPFDPVVQPVDEDLDSPNDVQFRKIGEASYSEVFGIGNVVLKVIPLRDDTSASAPAPISDIETPFPSEAKDVLKEIIVTRAMGAVCEGFVTLLKTYIVRGKYPEILLALWDEYDDRKGSEGVRPGMSCLPL
jgi:serine/threonine-protein kinase haspin